MYRLLLLLLPRHRRAAYGAEMAEVFTAVSEHAKIERGWIGMAAVWMKEILGMVRFSVREHARGTPGGPSWRDELVWAWRGVRGRRWRAVAIVMLFGIALGANAIVFSAADAFVFRTVPYAHPEQLVVMQRVSQGSGAIDYAWRDAIFEWRKHSDLFVGIQAHDRGGSAYLSSDGVTEAIRAQSITPGMFELLGILPRQGRPFVSADAEKGAPPVVVISDALARRLFGGSDLAIGKTFFTGTDTPTVVGVMAPEFRFPSAVEQIWRPLNLEALEYNTGVRHVARLRDGWTVNDAAKAFADRLPAVVASVPQETRRFLNRAVREKELSLRSLSDFSAECRCDDDLCDAGRRRRVPPLDCMRECRQPGVVCCRWTDEDPCGASRTRCVARLAHQEQPDRRRYSAGCQRRHRHGPGHVGHRAAVKRTDGPDA